MSASEPITLSRACEVIEIPSGIRGTLPAGAVVRIMQSLGSGYTVATDRGYMYRVDAKDTDVSLFQAFDEVSDSRLAKVNSG